MQTFSAFLVAGEKKFYDLTSIPFNKADVARQVRPACRAGHPTNPFRQKGSTYQSSISLSGIGINVTPKSTLFSTRGRLGLS